MVPLHPWVRGLTSGMCPPSNDKHFSTLTMLAIKIYFESQRALSKAMEEKQPYKHKELMENIIPLARNLNISQPKQSPV